MGNGLGDGRKKNRLTSFPQGREGDAEFRKGIAELRESGFLCRLRDHDSRT